MRTSSSEQTTVGHGTQTRRRSGAAAVPCVRPGRSDANRSSIRSSRELAIPNASVHKGGIREAIATAGRAALAAPAGGRHLRRRAARCPRVNELAEVCEPGVTVITIGDRNDVGLFRDLINNGVSDYLVKPITPALLQKSLLNVLESATAEPPERSARPAGRRRRRTRRGRRYHAGDWHRLDHRAPTPPPGGAGRPRPAVRDGGTGPRSGARAGPSRGAGASGPNRRTVRRPRHGPAVRHALRAQRRGVAGRADAFPTPPRSTFC